MTDVTSRALRPLMRGMMRDNLRSMWENPSVIVPATMAEIMALGGQYSALYDLAAPGVLWQDSVGTLPVTAPEQPVGLVLDARSVRGPELMPNPSLDDLGAWAAVTATGYGEVIGGQWVTVSAPSGARLSPITAPAAVIGRTYEMTLVVDEITAGELSLRYDTTKRAIGAGTYVWLIYATLADRTMFDLRTVNTTSAKVTSVSVREVVGNHLRQPTTTARPLIRLDNGKGYLWQDGVDDQLVATAASAVKADMLIGTAGMVESAYTLTNRPFTVGDSTTRLSAQYLGATNVLNSSSAFSGLPGPLVHTHGTVAINDKYHVMHWQTATEAFARFNDNAETAGLAHPVDGNVSLSRNIETPSNPASQTVQRWYGGFVYDGPTTQAQRNIMQAWLLSKRGANGAGAGI